MIPFSLYVKVYFEVMIKSITNFLIIFFIFQQLKSQISHIDQNGYNPFCNELFICNQLNCLKFLTSKCQKFFIISSNALH